MRVTALVIALVCFMAVSVSATASITVPAFTIGTNVQTVVAKLSFTPTATGTATITPSAGSVSAAGIVTANSPYVVFGYTPAGSTTTATDVTFAIAKVGTIAGWNADESTNAVKLVKPGQTGGANGNVYAAIDYVDGPTATTLVQSASHVFATATHLYVTSGAGSTTISRVNLASGQITGVAAATANTDTLKGLAVVESGSQVAVFAISANNVWYAASDANGVFTPATALSRYDSNSTPADFDSAASDTLNSITVSGSFIFVAGVKGSTSRANMWAFPATASPSGAVVSSTFIFTGEDTLVFPGSYSPSSTAPYVISSIQSVAIVNSNIAVLVTVANEGQPGLLTFSGAMQGTLGAWGSSIAVNSCSDDRFGAAQITGGAVQVIAYNTVDASNNNIDNYLLLSGVQTNTIEALVLLTSVNNMATKLGAYAVYGGFDIKSIAAGSTGVVYASGYNSGFGASRYARVVVSALSNFVLEQTFPSSGTFAGVSSIFKITSTVSTVAAAFNCVSGSNNVQSSFIVGATETSTFSLTPDIAGLTCYSAVTGADAIRIPATFTRTVEAKAVVTRTSTANIAPFYVGDSRDVTFTVVPTIPFGGASLKVTCGAGVTATTTSSCLSQSTITYTLTGTSAQTADVLCTVALDTAGPLNSLVTAFTTTNDFKVQASNSVSIKALVAAWSVAVVGFPNNAIATPRVITLGGNAASTNAQIVITPGVIPAAPIAIIAICTNLRGLTDLPTGTVTANQAQTLDQNAASITISFASASPGNVRCDFKQDPTGTVDKSYPAIPSAYFVVNAAPAVAPAVALTVSGVTAPAANGFVAPTTTGNVGTAISTYSIDLSGPTAVLAAGTTLSTQLTCTGTGVTIAYTAPAPAPAGVTVTGAASAAVTVAWSDAALVASNKVTLVITAPIVTDGSGLNVQCTWSPTSGSAANTALYAKPLYDIKFFVGAVKQFTVAAASQSVYQTVGSVTSDVQSLVTVTMPTGTIVIDTGVTLTYTCKAASTGAVVFTSPALDFVTGDTTKTFLFNSAVVDATTTCTAAVSGTDAAHFTVAALPAFTVKKKVDIAISGIPAAINPVSTLVYNVVATKPAEVTGTDTLTLGLSCSFSPSSASSKVEGSGSDVAVTTFQFVPASTTFTWKITVAAITPAGESTYVSCTWAPISGTTFKFNQPTDFKFWVGSQQQLLANKASTGILVGEVTNFQITTAAAAIVNVIGSVKLNFRCNLCGDSGSVSLSTNSFTWSTGAVFPSVDAVTNVVDVTGVTAGTVTCEFQLDDSTPLTSDLTHFLAPGKISFTVSPQKSFAITVDNGVGPLPAITYAAPTPIAYAASPAIKTTVTATVAAPSIAVTLSLACQSNPGSVTVAVTTTGGDTATLASPRANFLFTTATAAVFAIDVTTPDITQVPGVIITCTWTQTKLSTGLAEPRIVNPPPFSFYVGSTVQLTTKVVNPAAATTTPVVAAATYVYPGSTAASDCTLAKGCNFASVTVSTAAAAIGLGFTLDVTCNIAGGNQYDVFVTNTAVVGGGGAPAAPVNSNVLTLSVPAGATTTATYFVRSPNRSGVVTCTYSNVAYTDFRRFLAPTAATTFTISNPITLTASGEVYPAVYGTRNNIASTVATSKFTLTLSALPPVNVNLKVRFNCFVLMNGGNTRPVTVSASTYTFTSAKPLFYDFTITHPNVQAHTAETVQCNYDTPQVVNENDVDISPAPVFAASQIDGFKYTYGTRTAFTVTGPGVTIYNNPTNSQELRTYLYTFTPSSCTAELYASISGTCSLPGPYVANTDISLNFNSNMKGGYTVSVQPRAAVGVYTCTIGISDMYNGAAVAPTLTFEVVKRASVILTIPATTTTGTTTLASTVELSENTVTGVTVVVSCDSGISVSRSVFYFFPGTKAAQTFNTVVTQAFYGKLSCIAYTEASNNGPASQSDIDRLSDADSTHFGDVTATITIGTPYAFVLEQVAAGLLPCNEYTLAVTVPWLPTASSGSLTLTGSCDSGSLFDPSNSNNNYLTWTSGSNKVQTFHFLSDYRGANVVCRFTVGGDSNGTPFNSKDLFTAPANIAFTVGVPSQSFIITPPASTSLVSAATSGTFSVAPNSKPFNDVTVQITVDNGATLSVASLLFTSTSFAAQTFTVTAPAVDVGTNKALTVSYKLVGTATNSASPYFAVPANNALTVSNNVVFAASLTTVGTIYTGASIVISVKPDVAVGVDVVVALNCGSAVVTGAKTWTSGSTAAQTFTVVAPATAPASGTGSITCTAAITGAGASYATSTPTSLTVTYTTRPIAASSTGGSSGLPGGITLNPACPDRPATVPCSAFSTVSAPTFALYAAMLLAALFAARQ